MGFFSVTLIFEASGNSWSDFSLINNLYAKNHMEALACAKKMLKNEYPHFNFSKVWCWSVEGKPHTTL